MSFIREWQNLRQFQNLTQQERSVVFYAEDRVSWIHFEPLIRELTGDGGRQVCYITSDKNDPVLKTINKKIRTFYIGSGIIRTIFFSNLKAGVLIMTMPDMESFHIKRSKVYPVHYIYVFHSMVSTHSVYRKAAFDSYDTIFCVGPHHVEEIRVTEALHALKPKNLIEYGYAYIDTLLKEKSHRESAISVRNNENIRVLVAPSWGMDGLLETKGMDIVSILVDAGYHVTLRPHPVTRCKWPQKVEAIKKKYQSSSNFVLESDISSYESLFMSDCMISDWSGIALEYAFVLEKPVLFVDVPRKINNPEFKNISIEPLEVRIRQDIGEIVSEDQIAKIPKKIQHLYKNSRLYKDKILNQRSKVVFNMGCAGRVGAEYISRLI